MRPSVYVIAGPNGAGKTTFARVFLPGYAACRNFINADLIAQGVSPFSPEAASFRAGRLLLHEIRHFGKRGVVFGFETTLSGKTYLSLFRYLRRRGYTIHIFFLWVPTVELALSRIRERVLEGGHDVPEPVVRRRFERSLKNFFGSYQALADSWTMFDNSRETPEVIAFENERKLRIINRTLYEHLLERYGKKR